VIIKLHGLQTVTVQNEKSIYIWRQVASKHLEYEVAKSSKSRDLFPSKISISKIVTFLGAILKNVEDQNYM
jgi:hypothetical protein